MKNTNKAQSLIEYALIFGLVVVALTAMRVYLQRGVQGVIKISADQLGSQKDGLNKRDLMKGNISSSTITRTTSGDKTFHINPVGPKTSKTEIIEDYTTSSGKMTSVTKIKNDED